MPIEMMVIAVVEEVIVAVVVVVVEVVVVVVIKVELKINRESHVLVLSVTDKQEVIECDKG